MDQEDNEEFNVLVYDCTRKQRLMFLHIPKNAGTTIENVGNSGPGVGYRWGRFAVAGRNTMPDGNQCSAWHTPPGRYPAPNPYEHAEVFCVTRDPWLRLVSEYVYLTETWPKWHQPYVKQAGPDQDCTVEGLNAFAMAALTAVENGNRYILDCHMLPQWDYVRGPTGRQWCDHTLPIADLTNRFNALMTSHGIQVRMLPHTKENASTMCPKLKAMSPQDSLRPQTKAIARRVYAEDFLHLGDSLR